MLPSSFAGLLMVPELDAAGTLVFFPSLEWEADAQEGLYESPFCYKPRALRCSKDYEDGMAHDHDFEFSQADQLDYILYNQGNGFEELQRALQTSMATQLDLSWGSRGPGTALEELCRMTNDGLESLPDIQPFISESATFLSWKDLSSSHEITLARAFQAAVARQLRAKLTRSLHKLKLKDIIVMDVVVSGGVASNIFLRERWLFQARFLSTAGIGTGRCFNTPISSQRLRFNTDNMVMIAWALMHRFLAYDDLLGEPSYQVEH
ncbi:hypothetical protein BDR06DRAFT_1008626 [Suillus hirtellus]|nr:hypothetical protein BDR06DRAFT_1008626 [Suillus hirtellus]